MCDSSAIPRTSIVLNDPNGSTSNLVVFEKTDIPLKQEPSEKLDLKFWSSYCSNINGTDYVNEYNVELSFHNNLHELSDNYSYEVLCKAFVKHRCNSDFNQRQQHQILFSFTEKRADYKLSAKGTYVASSWYDIDHYCFSIRRFNDRADESVVNEKPIDIGSFLWTTGSYSDVSLLIGDKVLRAHKHVLSQSSEVFRAMFAHDMTESKTDIVKIDDLDAEVVEEMLSYAYTGKSGNVARMPRELFEAANRYQLLGLRRLCAEYFVFNVHYQNVVDILEMANLYDLKQLRDRAMTFVYNHEKEMVLEPSFQHFLCRSLKVNNVVETLLLAHKHNLENVKEEAFQLIKEHNAELVDDKDFLELFDSQPALMREVYIYIHKKST